MSIAAAAPDVKPNEWSAGNGVAIRLEHLTKRFTVRRGWGEIVRQPLASRRVAVVRQVTCEVPEGEFFGLLGPNGAGKTTLFKMLATLVVPDAGRATVMGRDVVREAAAVRRLLAPVTADERSLHWRLSARENLRVYAALHGLDAREARARIGESLEIVGLVETGAQLVGTFSSGMKQRLLIARALVARPQVLLLDEPTRSLDPVTARTLRTFLREEIAGRRGCTVLLATHSSEEARELCDRVAVLHRGRLLAVGSTQALSEEVGDARYVVWTRDPRHAAFAALVARGHARAMVVEPVIEDGWSRVRLEVPAGADEAARAISFLTAAGVSVSRFERVPVSLADLIERVVARQPAADDEERGDA